MKIYKNDTPFLIECTNRGEYEQSLKGIKNDNIIYLSIQFYSVSDWDNFFSAEKTLEGVYFATYSLKNNRAYIQTDDKLVSTFNITEAELATAIEQRKILINPI